MTQTTRAPRAARKPKPEGQWKVDGREPLNPNEVFKQADDGLNVRTRIEEVYSKHGFASIDPQDLHGRFRWWGLYTQRRPGIDGGRTGSLSDAEIEDEYFMMRVRLDGGALTREQLRVLGQISADFARDSADITDRQNIQYHWIRVEDVPEIWRRLEDAGLDTVEACGDVPRVILGSPLAGIAEDEIIDPTPVIERINARDKPLALYIFDRDQTRIGRIIRETSSGGVGVNLTLVQFTHANLPFGGVNTSGIGAGHGLTGFRAFSHERAVLRNRFLMFPLIFPPYGSRTRRLIRLIRRVLG